LQGARHPHRRLLVRLSSFPLQRHRAHVALLTVLSVLGSSATTGRARRTFLRVRFPLFPYSPLLSFRPATPRALTLSSPLHSCGLTLMYHSQAISAVTSTASPTRTSPTTPNSRRSWVRLLRRRVLPLLVRRNPSYPSLSTSVLTACASQSSPSPGSPLSGRRSSLSPVRCVAHQSSSPLSHH
jgi:hypothetical protein